MKVGPGGESNGRVQVYGRTLPEYKVADQITLFLVTDIR